MALLKAFQSIPDSTSVFEHVPHQAVYDLFTDGSCLYPSESYLRVAAWGVVVAGGLGAPGTLLATGHLPGLIQSAFRAELTAVISAAEFAAISRSKIRIWSDCLGVVRRFGRLLQGDWSPGPSTRNSDLWSRLSAVVSSCRDRIEIIKVEAHCESEAQATFVDEWCAHYNARVDNLAGTTNRGRSSDFWALWDTVRKSLEAECSIAQAVQALHGRVAFHSTRAPTPAMPVVPPQRAVLPPPVQLGQEAADPEGRLGRRYGIQAVRRIEHWFKHCFVDSVPLHTPTRWVSLLQLLLDYSMSCGFAPPVFSGQQWLDPGLMQYGQLLTYHMGQRTRWFGQVLRRLILQTGGVWTVNERRPSSTALQVKLSCIPARWSQTRFEVVEAFLSRSLPNGTVCGQNRGWRNIAVPHQCTDMIVP